MDSAKILNKTYKNFEFISAKYIEDCSSYALYFRHKLTGLEVFHLVNNDEENLFSFCFRTPIKNSTGAAHILEHSVLCGSKKFPLKEPFTNLMNQSLNTFLNAMTYPDKTVYPASSTVKEDYFNIMDVYADAVFFPLLRKESFMQEASRLELDENGEYSIQGVVYNEMKGCYSNFDSVANDEIVNSLFENTNYSFDSGGDPLNIPDFEYQDFIDFHKKYYKPSNCLVFLYGNIPTEEQLDFLEENYLSKIEKETAYKFNNFQTPYVPKEFEKLEIPEEIKNHNIIYKKAPARKDLGANVSVNWRCDENKNLLSRLECIFISELLINHDACPLSKVLIESELGDDLLTSSGANSDFRNVTVNFGLHGVKKGNEQKVIDLIFSELNKIAEIGVSKEIVDSMLMSIEFSNREIIRVDGPFSLVYLERVLNLWNYGGNPCESLEYRKNFEIIKKNYENDEKYIQKLVKKFFLDNKNYTLLCVEPYENYQKEREEIERKIINQKKSSVSDEEIISNLKKLKSFQLKKESAEETSCIKFISPENLKREIKKIDYKINFVDDSVDSKLSYLNFIQPTNGILYFYVGFPLDYLELEEYKFLNFYSYCVSEIGLCGKSWDLCTKEISTVSGGISTRFVPSDKFETENSKIFDEKNKELNIDGRDWILFNIKILSEKIPDALKLFSEYFTKIDFSDTKRIKSLFDEYSTIFKTSIISRGTRFMVKRAKKISSHAGTFTEITSGISQFFSIEEFAKMKIEEFAEKLKNIHQKIMNSGSILFSISDEETNSVLNQNLQSFIKNSQLKTLSRKNEIDNQRFQNLTILPSEKNKIENHETFLLNTQVGYSVFALPSHKLGTKENAAEVILAKYLTGNLLWEKLRTQGGAYGANASTVGINDGFFITTYRDPDPENSIDLIKESLKIVSQTELSSDELKKMITGNYGDATQPRSPYENGWVGIYRFLNSIVDEDRKKLLNDELDVTAEDIKIVSKELYEKSESKTFSRTQIVVDKSKKNKKNTGFIIDLDL